MPKPKKNRMSKAEKQEIENRKKAYRMECRALEEELEEENRNTNFYEQAFRQAKRARRFRSQKQNRVKIILPEN